MICALPLSAQVNATGTISGQVTDPGGAAVPNASVKVTEQNTGLQATVTSAADGYYTVSFLKPGIYTVEVSAKGFSTEAAKNLSLDIQRVAQQNFKLRVGAIEQHVDVEGTAALLNTETVEVGNIINQTSIDQLPLNGRNFSQLALLVPGTTPGPVGGIRQSQGGNETQRDGAEITTSGARGSFNLFTIDGLDDRDQVVGTIKIFPNLESIGEFKMQVANTDAEFATGGAVVNVITRSGSNAFHGSAFEFLRNQDLDSRGYFDGAKAPFRQNLFGGSIGGPIKKNKTFFFADYQGQRKHTATTAIDSEPTAAMRAGNYNGVATVYDPSTYVASSNTRQPFPGDVVPTSRFDPVGVNLLQVFALPNLSGVVNNFRFTPLTVQSQNEWDGRLDHTFSEKDSMFARYTYGGEDQMIPGDFPFVLNGALNPLAFVCCCGRVNHAPSTQATLQEIHSFSPTLVNQLALGYTRWYLDVTNADIGYNTSQKLGLQGSNTSYEGSGLAVLSLSGYTGESASNSIPEIVPQNTLQLSDTVSWTHGKHSMKFGGSVIHNDFGFFQLTSPAGSLSYSGTYTNNPTSSSGTGSPWADFLLGLPASSSKVSVPDGVPYLAYTESGLFWQDQWRATQRLTVTVGTRWDLFTWPTERYNRQSDFNPATGGILLAGQNGASRSLMNVHHNEFSPRIGLAYRLGDKTVIRTGYGLYFFNEQGTGGSARLFINYPDTQAYAVSCTSTVPCLNTATGIPNTLSPLNLPTEVYIPGQGLNSNMQQWNFTLEREITKCAGAARQFLRRSSHGDHLYIALNEDVATPGPGAVAAREPYPQYSSISAWEPDGISNYNALQLSIEKRFARGLMFNASYTYSRALDMGGGGNSASAESRSNVQNPRDVRAEYGLADFNFSHRFTFYGVYDLPFGKGRQFLSNANGLLNGIVGGWQADSIFQAQTGPPGTPTMATSTSNTGTTQYPNRICNGALSTPTAHMWYSTSCYVAPPIYTFGNAGRNVVIAPGYWSWDFGVHKDFRITEKIGLTFRGEFFNVLNNVNFAYPSLSIGSAAAGTITSIVGNARQIQFALRLHF